MLDKYDTDMTQIQTQYTYWHAANPSQSDAFSQLAHLICAVDAPMFHPVPFRLWLHLAVSSPERTEVLLVGAQCWQVACQRGVIEVSKHCHWEAIRGANRRPNPRGLRGTATRLSPCQACTRARLATRIFPTLFIDRTARFLTYLPAQPSALSHGYHDCVSPRTELLRSR